MEILEKFKKDSDILAYGFGALINDPPEFSYFFPINLQESDHYIDNVA